MARISSRAFTLIELLIVIAIIGILMALLFPAVNGAIDAARKAQAKNDVTQIATAVVAYETEYGKLPDIGGEKGNVDGDLVKTLTAERTNNNPRKIVFIEIGQWKKNSKSGTNDSGAFLDAWGNPYKIAIDHDYDNTISGAGKSPGPTVSGLRKKVAVWNDLTNATDPKSKRRGVGSWE